jgi:hypothetical protein
LRKLILLCCIGAVLNACSVFDPNPGEKEVDQFIHKKDYEQAIRIVEPLAEQGIPWAQLRLGIAYEYGQGKKQDFSTALEWYHKSAGQMVDLPWGDGVQLISAGDAGYFNQNNDARVAQYLIARIYAEGRKGINKNPAEAWLWAQYAQKSGHGNDIVFCCENSKLKTKKIEAERIQKIISDTESELSDEELKKLQQIAQKWKPN